MDTCVLVNEKKNVVEASNANIFLVKGRHTNPRNYCDGCIKGLLEKKMIELLEKNAVLLLKKLQFHRLTCKKPMKFLLRMQL